MALLAIFIALACLSAAPSASAAWVLIGSHPWANQQPTTPGKTLVGLTGFEGKLYVGYGDTSANTGPIHVSPWEPAISGWRDQLTVQTEAIWAHRKIGTLLYTPSADPRNSTAFPAGADYAWGRPWTQTGAAAMTHAFDIAQLGTSLFLVGSRDVNAVVVRSTNGGATWSSSLSIGPASGDIARFYFAAIHNNRLYVQGYNYYGDTPHASSRYFDGAIWRTGPNLLPLGGHGWKPAVFGSSLLYQTRLPNNMLNTSGNDRSRLMAFNGASVTSPLANEIRDFAVHTDGYVYTLGVDGVIRRSSNLSAWATFSTAPANTRSIGFLNGLLYAGTSDAKLYRLDP
jgi:hypothetical protein